MYADVLTLALNLLVSQESVIPSTRRREAGKRKGHTIVAVASEQS
jgi:hypothetical protein